MPDDKIALQCLRTPLWPTKSALGRVQPRYSIGRGINPIGEVTQLLAYSNSVACADNRRGPDNSVEIASKPCRELLRCTNRVNNTVFDYCKNGDRLPHLPKSYHITQIVATKIFVAPDAEVNASVPPAQRRTLEGGEAWPDQVQMSATPTDRPRRYVGPPPGASATECRARTVDKPPAPAGPGPSASPYGWQEAVTSRTDRIATPPQH